MVFSAQRSAGDHGAVQHEVGGACGPGCFQGVVQVGCPFGEHRGGLVDVAVGGGAADAVVGGQVGRAGAVAVVPQNQDGLLVAGQGAASLGGAAPAALCGQELGDEENGFPGDVQGGTIGDHVEPFTVVRLWFRHLAFYLGLHVCVRGTVVPPGSPVERVLTVSVTGNSLGSPQ